METDWNRVAEIADVLEAAGLDWAGVAIKLPEVEAVDRFKRDLSGVCWALLSIPDDRQPECEPETIALEHRGEDGRWAVAEPGHGYRGMFESSLRMSVGAFMRLAHEA